MKSTTVRISLETREKLRALAASRGVSMQYIVDETIEGVWRKDFWERTNAAYAALRDGLDTGGAEQEELEYLERRKRECRLDQGQASPL